HRGQLDLALLTVAGDVQHEPAALSRPGLHSEARQLLEGVQHLPVLADELAQPPSLGLLGDDLYGRAPVVDRDVDVSVEVSNVEKFLEVVRSDLALFLEALQ